MGKDVEIVRTIAEDRYQELLLAARWLEALEQAGVDNWEGISHAHEIMQAEGYTGY